MSVTYNVTYSRDAAEDLRDIAHCVARASGSMATAKRQLTMVRDAVRRLDTMPPRHMRVEDEAPSHQGYRRMNVGSYAILYLVDEDSHDVLIVRTAGGRRSLREVLGSH